MQHACVRKVASEWYCIDAYAVEITYRIAGYIGGNNVW